MDGKIRVAVIDSGINTQISNLDKYVSDSTGFYVNSEGKIEENKKVPTKNIHGTVIAMIMHDLCNDIELISVNILDEKLSTEGRVLVYALSKVFDYNPDIIHMSLGTLRTRYIFPLKKIIWKANKNNILVVAAAENSGKISYPAYLRNVIGVKAGHFETTRQYDYQNGFFYAPSGIRGIEGVQNLQDIQDMVGSSMSAAYISGHLARQLKEYGPLSFKEAKNMLIRNIKERERENE